SRRFPAFMLGRDPELRLISASHTADLAVSMNRDVQRIMTSEAYAKLFFETRLAGSPLPPAAPACGPARGALGRPAGEWQGPSAVPARARLPARRTLDLFEIPGHRGSLRSAGVGNSIAGNRADGAIIDDPFGKRED